MAALGETAAVLTALLREDNSREKFDEGRTGLPAVDIVGDNCVAFL